MVSFLDKFKSQSPKDKSEKDKKVQVKGQKEEPEKTTKGKEMTLAEMQEKKEKVSPDQTKKKEQPKKKVALDDTKRAYAILIKPIISEKGTYLKSINKYLFEVSKEANKLEVKKAIKAVYGVWPIKVNIIKTPGKYVRYRRERGKTVDKKKAIVTLEPGQTIDIYEGV